MSRTKKSKPLSRRIRNALLLAISQRNPRVDKILRRHADTPGLLTEFARSVAFSATIRADRIQRVFVLSMSRSGSHNFVSRFHYLQSCFVLRENTLASRDNTPAFSRFPRKVPVWGALLGMFTEQSLQNKRGRDLRRIVYVYNHLLRNSRPLTLDGLDPARDRLIYLLRNPFRILHSLDSRGRAAEKLSDLVTDELFPIYMERLRLRLEELLHLLKEHPALYTIVSHEIFCARPAEEFARVCDFIGINARERTGWEAPEEFFQRCFGTGERPVLQDGKLFCPILGRAIEGSGGSYSPAAALELPRTMNGALDEFLTPERLDIARLWFGEPLVDFWRTDGSGTYASMETSELISLILKSLASAPEGTQGRSD